VHSVFFCTTVSAVLKTGVGRFCWETRTFYQLKETQPATRGNHWTMYALITSSLHALLAIVYQKECKEAFAKACCFIKKALPR